MKGFGRILLGLIIILIVAACVFGVIYFSRFRTMSSIKKVTSYDSGYDLYRMDIQYDYSLDKIIASGITDDQSYVDAVLAEALPYLPIHMEAPKFACSAFGVQTVEGDYLMGRNYDFKNDTSAMLVYATPKGGYKSVAFAALDNVGANDADKDLRSKLSCLAAPFLCLDGVNEKGMAIAVLTLDSQPARQNTGKPTIATTLAIRLVLDRAATTAEAVDLLGQYDMFASSGRDYHFILSDATGDTRVAEYDCLSEGRALVVTPIRTVTNFFEIYKDRVLPDQHNDIYGHGRERYDAIEAILTENEGRITYDTAWQALQTAAQTPKEGDVTSNTQWSIVFNKTALTADIAIRRDWSAIYRYDLNTNGVTKQ